jgi:hypothetical protein
VLGSRVRALLAGAAAACAGTEEANRLLTLAARLDHPLRVALVGATKAGKSTLVNALVGERVAATDAAECTRVVTWYEHGEASQAWAHLVTGEARQLPFHHHGGRTAIDLQGLQPEGIHRLGVTVPSRRLLEMTLVDTPGLGSLSESTGRRTEDYLAGTVDDRPDAVVALLRNVHESDLGFLDPFHDAQGVTATAVNTVGVLSRADEVAPGRPDSLDIAAAVARRLAEQPRLRTLVLNVLPVSGLLAETAATLRADEYAALARLAALPADRLAWSLSSVDRFTAESDVDDVEPREVRSALLDRLGFTGVRIGVVLVGSGLYEGAADLSEELLRRSGLAALQMALTGQFAARADILKAATALRTVSGVLDKLPRGHAERLRRDAERIQSSAHGFAELRLLEVLRQGDLHLDDEDRLAAESLLGTAGSALHQRLRLPPQSSDVDMRTALFEELTRWQRVAENPFSAPELRRAAQVLRHTCEAMQVAGTC